MFTSSSQVVEDRHQHQHQHHQLFSYPIVPRPVLMGDHHHHQRRWKPNVEIAPNCPRCNSSNTKFCYYNNYSLTQPRYFCKGCRRYWTKGGSLRNVPIGGGCRKSRRATAVRSEHLRHHHRVSTTTTTTNYGTNSMGVGVSHHDASVNANSTNIDQSNSSDEPTNIDLALVYAKFLNQRPDHCIPNSNPNHDHDHQHVDISEFARDDNQFDSTSSNIATSSSVWEPNPNLDTHVDQQFPQEQEFGNTSIDHHEFNVHIEGKDEHQMLIMNNEFDLNYVDQQPLLERINSQTTGFDEDLINGQDIFWSNSPLMGSSSFTWQASQMQDFESTIHDPKVLDDDNWSQFDLPSTAQAFSRPSNID